MKILYCDFDEKWHGEILNELSERLDAEYVISLSNIDHNLERTRREYLWVNNELLNYQRYSELPDWDLPVLDGELLEHLAWCEALYLPMLDRAELVLSKKLSYQERKRFYYTDLKIMLYLLKRVDICIFSSIPHVGFDYALYGLCRELKVPYVIQFYCTPVPGATATIYFMQDIFNHIPQLSGGKYLTNENSPEEVLPERMRAYFDYYGRNKKEIKQVIAYTDFDEEYETPGFVKKIQLALERQKKGLLGATVRRRISNLVRTKAMNAYFAKNCYKPQKEKYIYCPLHYQPECTSLPMGGMYHDQYLMIEQLSKYVPDDVKIYVKPHPFRSWFADEEYYNRIRSYKNVCLISPDDNSYDLIDSSLAVISLTGTAILESMIRNVPVLMFGYYIWQYAPGVFHCETNEDVKSALDRICNKGFKPNKADLRRFFIELDKYVSDGSSVATVNRMCGISMETSRNNIVNGYISYLKDIGVSVKSND